VDYKQAASVARHMLRVFLGTGGLVVAFLSPDKWHIGIAMLLYAIFFELASVADAHAKT